MKKTVLFTLMLLVALFLTACGQNQIIQLHTVRWEAGETLVYDVSIDGTGAFSYNEVKGALKIPTAIGGTFTMTVNEVDQSTMVTKAHTELDIWSTYLLSAIDGFDTSEIDSRYIKLDENTVSFRTTTVADVEFARYSCNNVRVEGKGAVVVCGDKENGENNTVEFNDYTAVCESFSGTKATYTLTHNNKAYPDKSETIDLGTAEFTDNTALLYIIRSLTLSDLKTAGSMSIVASDIVAGEVRNVKVSTASSANYPKAVENRLLETIGEEAKNKLFVCKASTGNSMRGSVNYFYMDTDTDIMGNNVIHTAGQSLSKNRIIAMQQGYMVFVLRGI